MGSSNKDPSEYIPRWTIENIYYIIFYFLTIFQKFQIYFTALTLTGKNQCIFFLYKQQNC